MDEMICWIAKAGMTPAIMGFSLGWEQRPLRN